MVDHSGDKKNGRKKSRKLNYFFLNGNLHKSLHINRSADVITAWSYPDNKRIGYTYSDVRRRMQTAFTTTEVAKLVNRSKLVIELAILAGSIEEPQYTYGLNEHKKKYKYMWREEDIMALHAYLSTVHRGRPRKDGLITTVNLPSARELRAMVRQQPIMGYLDAEGNFRPTWLSDDL